MGLILIGLGILIYTGKLGSELSECFLNVSEKYKNYPSQYQKGFITQEEFENQFIKLRSENEECQQKTSHKYFAPTFVVSLLTNIATKGRGLP